jgi:hypothetical protein
LTSNPTFSQSFLLCRNSLTYQKHFP